MQRSPEHSAVSESRKVLSLSLSLSHTHTHTHTMVVCQGDQVPTEKSPNWRNWEKLSKKEKKSVLDYNPQYRIIF